MTFGHLHCETGGSMYVWSGRFHYALQGLWVLAVFVLALRGWNVFDVMSATASIDPASSRHRTARS
jgi:hypothetical protein